MLFMKYKYVQINDNDASLCIAECSLSSTKIRKKVEFYKK